MKHTALLNLSLVFPDSSKEYQQQMLNDSCSVWSQVIVDTFRLAKLDQQWIREHVEFPDYQRFLELRAKENFHPALFLSGHQGSFELLTVLNKVYDFDFAFVARKLKPESLDKWWNQQRTGTGNILIPRKGAIKSMLSHMSKGRNVGVLFDQNVKRNQAIFVDWFQKPAATTVAISVLALKFHCPIYVLAVENLPDDRYRINMIFEDYHDIYDNPETDNKQKAYLVTERASNAFQQLILKAPEQWFWFHRRWKTGCIQGDGFYD